jgi:hypothetical protein
MRLGCAALERSRAYMVAWWVCGVRLGPLGNKIVSVVLNGRLGIEGVAATVK